MKKFLTFLGVMDGPTLSLTKLAFLALTVKIVVAPTLDWASMVTFLGILLSYMHKRSVSQKPQEKQPIDHTEDIEKIKEQLSVVTDIAEKAKDSATKIALAAGFAPKK